MPDEAASPPEYPAVQRREVRQRNRRRLRRAAKCLEVMMALLVVFGLGWVLFLGITLGFGSNLIQLLSTAAPVFATAICGFIVANAAFVLADISEMMERE